MWTLAQVQEWFRKKILEADADALPAVRAGSVRLLRLVYLLLVNLTDGQWTLRAMSLVFTSLLAMVPLLAVSFSVLKAFGVHNQIEPLLLNFFSPLGAQARDVTGSIIAFVDNVKVGVLGSVGLFMLFYTVVSLIQKVEEAFNIAWRVEQNRPLASRFTNYLSVILIGPVLVFSALGVTGSVMRGSFVQSALDIMPVYVIFSVAGKLLPFALIIAAFTFIYIVIPNTRVRFGPALMGGTIAGILWEAVGWGFAHFVVQSTQYTAIYSGFAIVIVFMFWLYLAWLILLAGASIAFYRQHPDYLLSAFRLPSLSPRLSDEVALSAMSMIARKHYAGEGGMTMEAIARALGLPLHLLKPILKTLEAGGLLACSELEAPVYLPARPLETMAVRDVLDILRRGGKMNRGFKYRPEPEVLKTLARLDEATAQMLGAQTVKELVMPLAENQRRGPSNQSSFQGTTAQAP